MRPTRGPHTSVTPTSRAIPSELGPSRTQYPHSPRWGRPCGPDPYPVSLFVLLPRTGPSQSLPDVLRAPSPHYPQPTQLTPFRRSSRPRSPIPFLNGRPVYLQRDPPYLHTRTTSPLFSGSPLITGTEVPRTALPPVHRVSVTGHPLTHTSPDRHSPRNARSVTTPTSVRGDTLLACVLPGTTT